MLFKESDLYSVTTLTDYGRDLLLKNPEQFRFTYFSLSDQETNYNFINKDNVIAKGLGRLDPTAEDDYSDIVQEVIFNPLYKTEDIQNYLIGDYNKHNLLPDKIQKEFDLFIDMQGIPINLNNVATQSQKAKKIELVTKINSGNIGIQELATNQLDTFSVLIDIEGVVYVYDQGDKPIQLIESLSVFDKLRYEIFFQSTVDISQTFTFSQEVDPNIPFIFSIKNIKDVYKKGNGFLLYGIVSIKKIFTFEGIEYSSDIIKIELKEKDEQFFPSASLLTVEDVFKYNQLDIERRNLYISVEDFDKNKLDPKIYISQINNTLLNQSLNGYLSLKDTIILDCSISYANYFRFVLKNLNNNQEFEIFNLIGSATNNTLLTTLVGLKFKLQFIKQETANGIFLNIIPIFPEKVGTATLNIIPSDKFYIYNYQILQNQYHWVNIVTPKNLFLGDRSTYDNLQNLEKLFILQCDENQLVYNYDFSRSIYNSDLQNLIFDVVN